MLGYFIKLLREKERKMYHWAGMGQVKTRPFEWTYIKFNDHREVVKLLSFAFFLVRWRASATSLPMGDIILALKARNTTLSITTFSKMTLSVTTFSKMTLSVKTFSIMTLSITINKSQHSAKWQLMENVVKLTFIYDEWKDSQLWFKDYESSVLPLCYCRGCLNDLLSDSKKLSRKCFWLKKTFWCS